jgi:5-methylcytosine-specific restriction endonuclease McrA
MGLRELQNIRDHRDDPKPVKRYSIPKISKKRAKKMLEDKATFEQDKLFYEEIWRASPHMCQCGCRAKLGKEPLTTFFHHLLAKKASEYPELRHTPENIMILHPDCHNAYHSNPLNRPEITRRQGEVLKLYEAGKFNTKD